MQKAIAYHEFRLLKKVFEAIKIILSMKLENEKENVSDSITKNKKYIG